MKDTAIDKEKRWAVAAEKVRQRQQAGDIPRATLTSAQDDLTTAQDETKLWRERYYRLRDLVEQLTVAHSIDPTLLLENLGRRHAIEQKVKEQLIGAITRALVGSGAVQVANRTPVVECRLNAVRKLDELAALDAEAGLPPPKPPVAGPAELMEQEKEAASGEDVEG